MRNNIDDFLWFFKAFIDARRAHDNSRVQSTLRLAVAFAQSLNSQNQQNLPQRKDDPVNQRLSNK